MKTPANRGIHNRFVACPCNERHRSTCIATPPRYVLQLNILDGWSSGGIAMVCILVFSFGRAVSCANYPRLMSSNVVKCFINYCSHAVAYPQVKRLTTLYPSTPPAKSEHTGRMVIQA